jgi:hypothetical protein
MSTRHIPEPPMYDALHLEANLVPPDEPDADVHWLEYCRQALQVNKHHVLECVLSDLDTGEASPLWPHIVSACQVPHEPGRARESITILAQLGQALLECIARAVDDQVNLRMAVED